MYKKGEVDTSERETGLVLQMQKNIQNVCSPELFARFSL